MPTIEAEPTPKPATWEEWMSEWPPGELPDHYSELLTREELVEMMANSVVAPDGLRAGITANELRYLESTGVVPRPVRKRHMGATRAVYPIWMGPLLTWLRVLQRRGVSPQDIGPWLRKNAALIARSFPEDDTVLSSLLASAPSEATVPPNLRRELERLARHHARTSGIPTTRVDVMITDAEGNHIGYHLPISVTTD